MDVNIKKALLLLKSLIFHYHGLDDDEKAMLEQTASKLNAQEEMEWANEFISKDYLSAFERSREFLHKIFILMDSMDRIEHLLDVWEDMHKKGYITETEATAILILSKDWHIEKGFFERVHE